MINSFTFSKLFEDTAWVGPEIAGRHIEHKLGGEDRPFHLSIAPIWQIPVGRGQKFGRGMPNVPNAVLGGWQISGQFNIQSGVPVVFGTDSFFSGKDFALPHDKQSLNAWFDTSQFIPFPSKNADISNHPAWTGIQNLPGYNYKPAAGDSIKNGVYQDFALLCARTRRAGATSAPAASIIWTRVSSKTSRFGSASSCSIASRHSTCSTTSGSRLQTRIPEALRLAASLSTSRTSRARCKWP